MRIVFFGLPLAAWLLHADGHEIVLASLSRTDTVGKRRLVRAIGAERVLLRPALDDALRERVEKARPDLVVSWFWTTRLPVELVACAPLGGFGVHPSLLPRHRGPDPTTWAILEGDHVTGVTAHRLAAEYDTGAILGHRELAIAPDWNAWKLAKALDRPSLSLLREICARYARGEAVPELKQDERLATQAPILEPDDERIALRWSDSTEKILRVVRALAPSPGAATDIGEHAVTVLAARRIDAPAILEEPGEAAFLKGRAVVKTGDGAIQLLEVEVEGEVLREEELEDFFA